MTTPTPGGRRARTRSAASGAAGSGRRLVPIAVLLVAALLVGWSAVRDAEPAASPPGSTELPLTRSELACAGIGAAGLPGAKAGIGFTSLSTEDGDAGADAVEILPLPKGKPIDPPGRPAVGAWQVTRQAANKSGSVLLSATGPLAAGAAAYTATRASDGAGGGLAVGECVRAGREAWFVGAGSTVDHISTLLLSNPGTTEAVADVSLLTAEGPLEPVRTQGLVLGPRAVLRLPLSEFAAGKGDTAVHVAATQGQVAATVLDTWTRTLEPAGTEWIPSAQPPATSLTVGTLVADAARSELIIGNPGERSTTVDIQVAGPDGTAPVQEFESVRVGAGAVEVLTAPKLLNDRTAVLRLESDQPVVASLRSRSGGDPVDLAYGTSLPDLTGPAVVPLDLPAVDPEGLRLVVTGTDPDAETEFEVEVRDAKGGSLAKTTSTAAPGAVAVVEAGRRRGLNVDLDKAAYLVVSPTSGPLLGSATFAAGDSAWSAVPLRSAPMVVRAPGVYPLP